MTFQYGLHRFLGGRQINKTAFKRMRFEMETLIAEGI